MIRLTIALLLYKCSALNLTDHPTFGILTYLITCCSPNNNRFPLFSNPTDTEGCSKFLFDRPIITSSNDIDPFQHKIPKLDLLQVCRL